MSAVAPLGEGTLRRERRRRRIQLSDEQRQEIADRVCRFYERDLEARSSETELRLQRHAKYRQWRSSDEGWPWPHSSNQAIPDMMEASIRMQDTLHNAVMSARPVVVSRALQEANEPKQKNVDALHDTQMFIKQNGERMIEHAAEAFCNDPAVTLWTTWITDRREVQDTLIFDPIPEDQVPVAYFRAALSQKFPEHSLLQATEEGWDWEIEKGEDQRTISFYTRDSGDVEARVVYEPIVFDGPRTFVLDYDDVICPPGVENLDIPSPQNPNGAPHVILRSRPTLDEVVRLARRRGNRPAFFDELSAEDRDRLEQRVGRQPEDESESFEQKSVIEGVTRDWPVDPAHGRLTRLLCFDTYDIDGDGKTEDVVFWVIYEARKLCRVRYLTEVFPGSKPERPLAESSFLPVGGRRAGISLLETMEGLHDFLKETVDQMVDNGTLANLPWFAYRASSSVKPETLRPGPGDGIPLNDPRNDINVIQFRNDGQAFSLNLVALIRQQAERLTLQGDIQAGRVPAGASSALRTLGGIQTLLSQGESRPERILRRFFMALTTTFRHMHRLNRAFIRDDVLFRAAPTVLEPQENPYFKVSHSDVDLDLEFDFHANVLNSSKQAVQQGLQAIASLYISEVAVQMGLTTPETAFRILRDLGQAFGQNVDSRGYLAPPGPQAAQPRVEAVEAVILLADGVVPNGVPAEGSFAAHLEKLREITEMDLFGAFPTEYVPLLRSYMQTVARQAQAEQQQQARAQAAGPLGAPVGEARGQPGRPPGPALAPDAGLPGLPAGGGS